MQQTSEGREFQAEGTDSARALKRECAQWSTGSKERSE